ncbi:MAG: hypothetical protein ACLFQV_13320 [Vulcanimicrobiota bacterium]
MEKNKKIVITTIIGVLVILILARMGWLVYQNVTLQQPLDEIKAGNEKFKNISVSVSYGGFLNKDTLIFNLKKIDNPEKLTAFELLAEYAKKMNPFNFNRVLLQYRGKTKYVFKGLDFRAFSNKAQVKEIEFLAMETPSLLETTERLPAFEKAYGDEQWVIQKNVSNFKEFLSNWYIDDWVEEQKDKFGKTPMVKEETPKPETETVTPEVEETPVVEDTPEPTPIEEIPVIEPENL